MKDKYAPIYNLEINFKIDDIHLTGDFEMKKRDLAMYHEMTQIAEKLFSGPHYVTEEGLIHNGSIESLNSQQYTIDLNENNIVLFERIYKRDFNFSKEKQNRTDLNLEKLVSLPKVHAHSNQGIVEFCAYQGQIYVADLLKNILWNEFKLSSKKIDELLIKKALQGTRPGIIQSICDGLN